MSSEDIQKAIKHKGVYVGYIGDKEKINKRQSAGRQDENSTGDNRH